MGVIVTKTGPMWATIPDSNVTSYNDFYTSFKIIVQHTGYNDQHIYENELKYVYMNIRDYSKTKNLDSFDIVMYKLQYSDSCRSRITFNMVSKNGKKAYDIGQTTISP